MRNYSNQNIDGVQVYDKINKIHKKVAYSCYCPICQQESYVYQTDLTKRTGMCSKCTNKVKGSVKHLETFTGYIYGIYVKDELYYIGLTSRAPNKRWAEHKHYIIHGSQDNMEYTLYSVLRQFPLEDIQFKIIEIVDNIVLRQLQEKEKYYIEKLSPKCNWDGVHRTYTFTTPDCNEKAIEKYKANPTKFLTKKMNGQMHGRIKQEYNQKMRKYNANCSHIPGGERI